MSNQRVGMKQLPADDRPYEKCLTAGAGVLSDAELISVILRTGSRQDSALETARRILDQPGCHGLAGLSRMSVQDLIKIPGIGPVKAVQLLCVAECSRRIHKMSCISSLSFQDPESVAAYYMEDFRHLKQEKVLLLMLDAKGHLLGEKVIASGTVCSAPLSPREIFLTALTFCAVSVILLHNHPSGDPFPSEEDIQITERIRLGGELLGITLLDHIILGDQTHFSFRSDHLIIERQGI